MKRTLVIMAKVPLAGTVKTRLQPFLPPQSCAELSEAFLLDTESKAKGVCENTILAYWPAAQRNVLRGMLRHDHVLIEQKGADLGERMRDAFEFAFRSEPGSSVVMVGTDSPTFPPEFIEESFAALDGAAEVVIGKTEDGGIYLIGLKALRAGLFEGVRWGTPAVFGQLSDHIGRQKLSNLKLLPTWYDVDSPDDLSRLYDEVSRNSRAGEIARHTHKWLDSRRELFGRDPAGPGVPRHGRPSPG